MFMVKQRNLGQLEDTLLRVSSPKSPDYGKHLSNDQVHKLTAPLPADVQAVASLLAEHGAKAVAATPNSDMIRATVTVDVAEKLLAANYVELHHAGSNVTIHRAVGGYSLPSAVAGAVDFVTPTVHVPGVRTATVAGASPSGMLGTKNTPDNLRTLYSVGDTVGKADKNIMAVTAFLNQKYSESSLKSYYSQYCEPKGLTCGDTADQGLPKLVGDATTGSPGVEAMLDIQSINGVGGNIHSEFWGFAGASPDNPDNEPFMKWLAQVGTTSDDAVPKLFSTSYGEDENSWSLPAATRLNAEFQKVGARGISLLYASGDEGANCKGGKFVAEGPGSSPFVTAVGGTQPTSGFPQPGSEEAVGLSSGGFSSCARARPPPRLPRRPPSPARPALASSERAHASRPQVLGAARLAEGRRLGVHVERRQDPAGVARLQRVGPRVPRYLGAGGRLLRAALRLRRRGNELRHADRLGRRRAAQRPARRRGQAHARLPQPVHRNPARVDLALPVPNPRGSED